MNFARRRQTELKHGHIAQLAAMGYITPEITGKWLGYLSPSAGLKFADVPNGLVAISKVQAAGWGQNLAYMAFCEVSQDQSAGTSGSLQGLDLLGGRSWRRSWRTVVSQCWPSSACSPRAGLPRVRGLGGSAAASFGLRGLLPAVRAAGAASALQRGCATSWR